ncbi:unnamed protein product, partial [Prorocentrum cordatum]
MASDRKSGPPARSFLALEPRAPTAGPSRRAGVRSSFQDSRRRRHRGQPSQDAHAVAAEARAHAGAASCAPRLVSGAAWPSPAARSWTRPTASAGGAGATSSR